jgi:hypothetical protein
MRRGAAEIENLRNRIAAIAGICAEYEMGNFSDPGRAIDRVRDYLGRRE